MLKSKFVGKSDMKKALLLIALSLCVSFVPSHLFAEALPHGCYVTYGQPTICYEPPSANMTWGLPENFSDSELGKLKIIYGGAMAAVIKAQAEKISSLNECQSSYNTLAIDKQACEQALDKNIDDYNGLADQTDLCIDKNNIKLKKIKRLRRRINNLKR